MTETIMHSSTSVSGAVPLAKAPGAMAPEEKALPALPRTGLGVFRTRVGQRIIVLFVVCAVVPVLASAWVSFNRTSRQVEEQSQDRLARDAKAAAMAVIERLTLLAASLEISASMLRDVEGRSILGRAGVLSDQLQEQFTRVSLLTEQGDVVPIFGTGDIPTAMNDAEAGHLRTGKVLVRHQPASSGVGRLLMYAAMDPDRPGRGVLMAEVNASYLWRVADGRPVGTEILVLDRSRRVMFASSSEEDLTAGAPLDELPATHSGILKWRDATGDRVAAFWTLFLMPSFLSPEWYLVLSQSQDEALALVREYRKAYPLIIVLSLSVVLLLSVYLIRRSLVPIEYLMGATKKVAEGGFGHTVDIRSGDEFELLGNSFNHMSRKLEEHQALLIRSAKLGTMGQMAAGVIHEVRQPLTAISGLVELSLLQEQSPEQRKRLQLAYDTVGRLDTILKRFRSFSQMSKEEMVPLSLKGVVDQVLALLEHQLRVAKVACVVRADEPLPRVVGDSQELHQVFSNLVMNALHAMESKPEEERKLTIRLHAVHGKVLAEIADTGCGMPPEVLQRIFDPFFTTKGKDKGTGLGMAIVESILHKQGASIEVRSEVGVGTTMTLTFPEAPAERSAGTGSAQPDSRKEQVCS